MTCMTDTDVVK